MELDVLVEAPAWEVVDLEGLAEAATQATLAELGLAASSIAVSILACDDVRISGLNAEFRGKSAPTNVLSWPSEERGASAPGLMPDLPSLDSSGPPEEIGDIAIAFETCMKEAEEGGKPFENHVSHLLVHGLLHCFGFDHETDADAQLMENLERRILASLGVPDPY